MFGTFLTLGAGTVNPSATTTTTTTTTTSSTTTTSTTTTTTTALPSTFLLFGTADRIGYSLTGGSQWTVVRTPLADTVAWRSGAYSPSLNRIATLASQGAAAYSDNGGISWTAGATTTPTTITWGYGTFAWSPTQNIYVAAALASNTEAQSFISSSNGINWTVRAGPTGAGAITWVACKWVPELAMFVAAGNLSGAGKIATSTDGINWTAQTVPSGIGTLNALAYGNGTLLVTGNQGDVLTSTDGINYVSQGRLLNNLPQGATYSPERGEFFVIGGSGPSRGATSVTGGSWTSVTMPLYLYRSIEWSSAQDLYFALVPGATGVHISSNGSTWTSYAQGGSLTSPSGQLVTS